MTQYIKKLPAVFQTVTEKKFFDATFDQVFSKKDSDLLAGYLGRRTSGEYNPVKDFYLPEPSKDRTWWQLEATAFARTADSTKSNIYFYEDLLNRINYYGGNTLNQDRLFESEYYSFGPPIDYDMFINYQNYYWIEQGLVPITLTGVTSADILGKASFSTAEVPGATPPDLTLTTGMSIIILGDPVYGSVHTVENIGGCIGIRLVSPSSDFTSGTIFEFLPWDGDITLSTSRVISNSKWDINAWDTQTQPGTGDYLTIERGSLDNNAWSRTNKWFHIDAITASMSATGTALPANATRALRPIIQFIADLELYKSGSQFRESISYGFRDNAIGNPLILSDYNGLSAIDIHTLLGITLVGGELVCFFNDNTAVPAWLWDTTFWDDGIAPWMEIGTNTVKKYIFQAVITAGIVTFIPYTSYSTEILEGDIVFITENGPFDSALKGQVWYYATGSWQEAINDKVSLNQAPLFQLFDHNGVSLDNAATYPLSTFSGSKIFSYKINTNPGATTDPVLGFPIVYTGLGQSLDIVFQNNLMTSRYTYSQDNIPIDIEGYYYYRIAGNPTLYNNWNLYQPCQCNNIEAPTPASCLPTSKQKVIDKFVVGYGSEYKFKLSVTPYQYSDTVHNKILDWEPLAVYVVDQTIKYSGVIYRVVRDTAAGQNPVTNPELFMIIDFEGMDMLVLVNGAKVENINEIPYGYTTESINNEVYVDLSLYLINLLSTPQSQPPTVEIRTYTQGLLDPASPGYFEIPQQLEANPLQDEVYEISGSNLVQHFSSIIRNQLDEEGSPELWEEGNANGTNNYRDTRKNRSMGSYILQNMAPLTKTMLVSSSDDLDFIAGERFSKDEYTKFKNKYLKTALQLINQGFSPVQYHNNTIIINAWVEEILKIVNISNEFSSAFAYSYMIASGSPRYTETFVIPVGGNITLANYVDLTLSKNAMYIYNTSTGTQDILLIDRNYNILSYNTPINIFINLPAGSTVSVALYENALPAYIPSTPSKIGAYPTFIPRIELDTSYAIPTNVVIGHDGSRTIAYNDYRDQLLLELEKRIYNLIKYKFRHQYYLPIRLGSVKSAYFRQTRYSRQEYLDITESYLNKWCAKNRANYRANDWVSASLSTPTNQLWKLYNYSRAKVGKVPPTGAPAYYLPGNWRGIYQYYYDTCYPNTRPWEMLGFSQRPSWWIAEYGTSYTPSNTHLWQDLEYGYIRQGPSAIYDPVTELVQPQAMWARPGLSNIIPVDVSGNIIPVPTLFNIAIASYTAPFDHFDEEWKYGDASPVEYAWMSTSEYAFSIQEFLYLMKPAAYGELMWDTLGIELSPGMIHISGQSLNFENPVKSNTNWQYVQNNAYQDLDSILHLDDDVFYSWMRPKNVTQTVHAELYDGNIQVRHGYQRWISDRILFLGKDITSTFGQKIRTLDVNLANKLAGFTNKDTTNIYIESVSPNATTTSLIIPSNNFEVVLHKTPVVDTYSYSGVIVRALADGTFAVYGYDLLNAEFNVLDRSNATLIDVTVGGTPAAFSYFVSGTTYTSGDIVRYNGIYYTSLVTQSVQQFKDGKWQKLKALPIVGGVSVTYKPVSEKTSTKIPYGAVFTSAQAVFDLLIGWGAYLESKGWQFQDVNQDTNILNDWLNSAKQFLFWLNTNWAPDASIQLSPLSNKATLIVSAGYPNDVESMSNGVYSILDKYGVAIPPYNTTTDREGKTITVEPKSLSSGGIYYLQVNTSETEHVIILDNVTSFNDTIYLPLLKARQERIRFNGFRSNGWYGKMEAPGYLVMDNQLVPNYDTIVDNMRYFYDPNVVVDNPSLEDLGRHLIGYESKSYLDNLQVANNVQYLFYQGAIRQKGTKQAFEKLFRSTKIQSNEIIQVFEEWALRVSKFGNTIEQVSTEFILKPEKNTGDVVIARLNYIPATIGTVLQINVLNAQNIYTTIPKVVIAAPDATPLPGWTTFDPLATYVKDDTVMYPDTYGNAVYYSSNIAQGPSVFVSANWTVVLTTRLAKAYIVLNSFGKISRVDITDSGAGYLKAPTITINSGTESHALDSLYSVWQGDIIKDTAKDNIVDIDINDRALWIERPTNPVYSLTFPTTTNIDYPLPNAGYVNFDDVTWTSFDVIKTAVNWGDAALNPGVNDTVWVAKNFLDDWNVYKVEQYTYSWQVQADSSGNLLLLLYIANTITPQLWTTPGTNSTDFGNMIVLQQVIDGKVIGANNYTVGIMPYSTTTYNAPGTYTDPNTLITYNAYYLTTLDGVNITSNEIANYADFTTMALFKTMRFANTTAVNAADWITYDDKLWVDNINNKWAVQKYSSITLTTETIRTQKPLINTSLFESANIFGSTDSSELAQLPIYDPFKNILPGPAKQNITYISLQDPASYNVTADPTLLSENITFAERQVGQLWWDISTTRYVYYEQPAALDGSETEVDNIIYRRNHWGQLFPGSKVAIYEWVKSDTPPALYTGTGVPRDVNTYVQYSVADKFTNISQINYYFWVLNTTTKPNLENRTMAALDVANMLQSPKSQGFSYFSPLQQSTTNNSYIFYNAQDILAYKGNNVQVKYRLSERDDQEHAQWAFFREGDKSSLVTDQFWNKMVDSLCGYTAAVAASTNPSAIIISTDLPWDMYPWDVEKAGEIFAIPDPMLSESEKYGIDIRPRQSMFVSLTNARKIFVQSANALLKYIPIRESDPNWNSMLTSNNYWSYTNWYAAGYENAVPNAVFQTLIQANNALATTLRVGDIVEVTDGTADGRFVLYVVEQITPTSTILSLTEVGIQNSAIAISGTVYTTFNVYNLSEELREILEALRTRVMIDEYLIDQNELFFSMVNYVMSEQKNPDWVFKSSYIYIKENNIPLTQDRLYVPDQIGNIINFITDSKPYHTQIRDYTSAYETSDLVPGTASDGITGKIVTNADILYKIKAKLQFGPDYAGEIITPPSYILDGNTLTQIVSRENVYTVDLTTPDPTKKGYSQLFPYTFSFDSINLNNPQTFITPRDIVAIYKDSTILLYGQNYYVEYNNDINHTYTIFFFEDPSGATLLKAFVWLDGGTLLAPNNFIDTNETAKGNATDDIVVNVDTQLPLNHISGVYSAITDSWDHVDTIIGDIVIGMGGITESFDSGMWDQNDTSYIELQANHTISFKENLNINDGANFYRNADALAGTLADALPYPTDSTENLNTVTVFVDPGTHPLTTDILHSAGAIWINGERIEYRLKTPDLVLANTWILGLVRRGTNGTSPTIHTIGDKVWVEADNIMPVIAQTSVWDARDPLADPTSETPPLSGEYTRVMSVPLGGLWYAQTAEATFLKQEQGKSLP